MTPTATAAPAPAQSGVRYEWRNGFSASGVSAEVAKKALDKIQREHGNIEPEVVVAEARASKHPLHDLFTWDDSEAAALYRLREARTLVRAVHVVVEGADPTPVYCHVTVERAEDDEDTRSGSRASGAYMPMTVVVQQESMLESATRVFIRQIESLRESLQQIIVAAREAHLSKQRVRALEAAQQHVDRLKASVQEVIPEPKKPKGQRPQA